jgi:dTDP-4-dehydrorhamnose reductase
MGAGSARARNEVAITGRDGQVVRSVLERASRRDELDIVTLARPELDLADLTTIGPAIRAARPDIVISAAAYTAVDKAEDESQLAHRINGEAPGVIGEAARVVNAPVLHLSTDYVYPGDLDRPYQESDAVGPTSVYGRTKLAGELALAATQPAHLILRTAWVYSPFGKNFLKTMLTLAGTRERISVVDDQIGNPTSAFDIADALLAAVDRWSSGSDPVFGTYHLAGTGGVSWCGFAREIMSVSKALGGPAAQIDAIPSSAFPSKVARPANSRLDSTRFERAFGYRSPAWEDSTHIVVERVLAGS